MPTLDLSLASGDRSLSVRRFAVHEGISTLFTVSVWVRSENPSLDLDAIVGKRASLRAVSGYKYARLGGARLWTGICGYMEQIQAEPTGLSTYYLRISPSLWLLTHRRNHRIFQHLSIPEIVDTLLGEWGVEHSWQVDRASYPKLEYKVQYGESDYAFVCRLLEEAGIAFTFPDDDEKGSVLTLGDALHTKELRKGGAIPYVDAPNPSAEEEYLTELRLRQEVRPGAHTIRDYDFRRPHFELFGEGRPAEGREARYEQYHYRPGSFLSEGAAPGETPVADDQGVARHEQKYGRDRADRALLGERMGKDGIWFSTNATDLWPGMLISMDHHPHAALHAKKKLLVTEFSLEGTPVEEWHASGHAVFAEEAYRPARRTPKPRVKGLQSARVVGPAGQEIHTDEFGRVRVQFPWDREGKSDEHSSCWIRVNQGWGGSVFGALHLPRIGQEVLIDFLQGDPDHPLLVGRVSNATQPVPYKLPEHKTRSTWKSDSSLGGGGFNEIMFEDLKGKELVFHQAEKDRKKLVKQNEVMTIVHDRSKLVKNDERERTEENRLRWVGKDEDTIVKADRRERDHEDVHAVVEGEQRTRVEQKDSLTVAGNRQIKVEANYALRAGRAVHMLAGEELVGESADVTIKGPGGFLRIDDSGVTISGTMVWINNGGAPGVGVGSKPDQPDDRMKTPPVDKPEPGFELLVVDGRQRPLGGAKVKVTQQGKSVFEGALDDNGTKWISGHDYGTPCEVEVLDYGGGSGEYGHLSDDAPDEGDLPEHDPGTADDDEGGCGSEYEPPGFF